MRESSTIIPAVVVAVLINSACGSEAQSTDDLPDGRQSLESDHSGSEPSGGGPNGGDAEAEPGDEARSQADGGDGADAGAALPDAGSPSEDAGLELLRFTVGAVPPATWSLEAHVVADGPGEITIEQYPERVELPLRHGTLPLSYEGAFSDEFCDEVQQIAELAARGEAFRMRAESMLRRTGSVTTHLAISPWVGPTFEARVVEAAREAGVDRAYLTLENPLVLGAARIELVLAPDAISHHLGVAAIQQQLSNALNRQRAQALSSGLLTLKLPGKDLWCDLVHGEAHLTVELEGSVGDADYHASTVIAGVEAL